jgi:hypothetical protein
MCYLAYWLTVTAKSIVCTAPASFTAIWNGTDLRAARSAWLCDATLG